jgi:hypothetical protein
MHDERAFDELMRQELSRAGFDPKAPRPAAAWEAFKAFVVRPVPGQKTITIGFTCYQDDRRDETLWLGFARRMEGEVDGVGGDCGCAFSSPVTEGLTGFEVENWWWAEHGSLDDWYAEVEAMPVFRKCMEATGWRFEGYSL